MVEGGWNVADGTVKSHNHLKFKNELEIDRRLILESPNKVLKNHLYGDNENIYFQMDVNGNGTVDVPHPLRLKHLDRTGWIYNNEIWHQGNLPIESGTFTPTLKINFDDTIAYSSQIGNYIRQGNFCFVNLSLTVTSHSVSVSAFQIEGMPFSHKLVNNVRTKLIFIDAVGFNLPSDCLDINPTILVSRNYLDVYWKRNDFGNRSINPRTQLKQNFFIRISGTYAV